MLVFLQVNYRKLLEMSLFSLSYINFRVGKLQDIGNKIYQTVGDTLSALQHHMAPRPSLVLTMSNNLLKTKMICTIKSA
jgi:hypothetical protein